MRNLTVSIRCKIWGSLLLQLEADFLLPGSGWGHQLPNGHHEGSNRFIMGFNFAFKLCQFMGQCLINGVESSFLTKGLSLIFQT